MTLPRLPLNRLIPILLTLGAFALAGCNTMDGAGKDLEKAGESIQDAAKNE